MGSSRAVSDGEIVRVSLPRHVYALAGLFGLLMLGTLALQLVMINDQRTTNDRQLEITARQSARAIPLLEDTQPLIDQVRDALPATARLGREALELTGEATPLVKELRGAQIDQNLRAAGALAANLLDADVGDATRAGRALAVEVLRADLPGAMSLLQRVVPEQARLLRRSVAVQTETLAIQKQALAAIRETLNVARETERHAESLDNKTGGSGTTGVPPPTEGPVP